MVEKKCACCNNVYPIENFPKDKTNKCGHRSYCFPCNRIKTNECTFKRRDKRKIENEKNREVNSKYSREYNKKHRKRLNEGYKNRLKNDPQFKIAHNTRVRINKALKNDHKNSSSKVLLGCEMDFYKEYLEKQFKPDMNWDNYGSLWDIDHIRPCATFDLSLEEEQKKCFHYTNTQPLYKKENQTKNKYTY